MACCKQANLITVDEELQLKKNKKKVMLTVSKVKPVLSKNTVTEQQGHDRAKHRYVDQDSYFLQPLGITDAKAQIIPSMARKWKQIRVC